MLLFALCISGESPQKSRSASMRNKKNLMVSKYSARPSECLPMAAWETSSGNGLPVPTMATFLVFVRR